MALLGISQKQIQNTWKVTLEVHIRRLVIKSFLQKVVVYDD